MPFIRGTIGGREVLRIAFDTTCDSVKALEKLVVDHLVLPERFTTALVDYTISKCIPCDTNRYEKASFYPLKFATPQDAKNYEEVWVSCCNAGYSGTGPHGTLECLRMMGFNISEKQEEELFGVGRTTDRVHLKFSK